MNNNLNTWYLKISFISDSLADCIFDDLFFILYLISVIFEIYTLIQYHSLSNNYFKSIFQFILDQHHLEYINLSCG